MPRLACDICDKELHDMPYMIMMILNESIRDYARPGDYIYSETEYIPEGIDYGVCKECADKLEPFLDKESAFHGVLVPLDKDFKKRHALIVATLSTKYRPPKVYGLKGDKGDEFLVLAGIKEKEKDHESL